MICTVVKAGGLTTAEFSSVYAVSPMMRATADNKIVYYFKNPKNKFYNSTASRILGREILGNAIIVGASAEELQTVSHTSWSTLASKITTIQLNERNLELQAQAERERKQAWDEYSQRKARRLREQQEEKILQNNLVEYDIDIEQQNE